jgi:hypothetical protein
VDVIVEIFEIYGARDVSPDVLINIREIILRHGRVMKHEGRIEANENSIKIIEGVFGNGGAA